MVVERTGDLEARLQALKLESKAKEQERMKDVVGIMGGKGRLGILAGVIARSSGGESGKQFTLVSVSIIFLWRLIVP
jgi:hypothetical protein